MRYGVLGKILIKRTGGGGGGGGGVTGRAQILIIEVGGSFLVLVAFSPSSFPVSLYIPVSSLYP